jgi:hypothetical protein
MNWIKENKFLTGVLAVAIIGGGVLGYLLFAAMGKYDEASSAFEAQSSELHRLQALPIFPDEKNRQTLQKQQEEYGDRIKALQRSMEAMQLPVEPLTPAEFQDRLKAAVTAYAEKAGGVHLKLPEKFFLGYERYQSVPPRPEAAPLLGRELKAIDWVLGRLAEDGVLELAAVKPEELAEEKGEKEDKSEARRPGAPAFGGPGPGGPGGRRERSTRSPIRKSPFTLAFVCEENTVRAVLNDIVTSKSQLYLVRAVELKSTDEKPPARENPNANGNAAPPEPAPVAQPANPGNPAAPAAPAAPDNSTIKAGEVTKFIVGEEKVQVTLLIEIVTFVPPPADEDKGGKPNSKPAQ